MRTFNATSDNLRDLFSVVGLIDKSVVADTTCNL